jgi:hypothetical protein
MGGIICLAICLFFVPLVFASISHPLVVSLPSWYGFGIHHRDSSLTAVGYNISVPKWSSQSGEDQHAFNTFFPNQVAGFYVEMGALDGSMFSNTLAFHKYLGWRGLLIEASPSNYQQVSSW